MNKYVLSLIVALSYSPSFANDNLERESRLENSWVPVEVLDQKNQKSLAEGYVTHKSKFRLSQLNQNGQVGINLLSSKKLRSSKLTDQCEIYRGRLSDSNIADHRFKLNLSIPQFKTQAQSGVVLKTDRGHVYSMPKIDNPALIQDVEVSIVLGLDSYHHWNRSSIKVAAAGINKQLKVLKTDLNKGEEVQIDITDYRSFVCDLHVGKIRLGLDVFYTFKEAKIPKREFIHLDDMQVLTRNLPGFSKTMGKNSKDGLVVSSGLLAESIEKTWGKSISELGYSNFVKLQEFMFNGEIGIWNKYSDEQLKQISDMFYKLYPRQNKDEYLKVQLNYTGQVSRD